MTLRVIQHPHQTHDAQSAWVKDLNEGAQCIDDLVMLGLVSTDEAKLLESTARRFKFRVGRYYLSLIDVNDTKCPIRLQAIPSAEESRFQSTEVADPTGDNAHRVTPLLIHRYADRVLLMPTLNCPMYCRYCFRKVGLNEAQPSFLRYWRESEDYLRAHTEIEEVILSGGDPLLSSDKVLARILDDLGSIDHIRRVRVHTRVPVTLPSRITESLVEILQRGLPLFLVTHFNHPREITEQSLGAITRLRERGVELFNQSVLLKGVNDDAPLLKSLFGTLLDNGVRPYYLHHPDLTVGTNHLRVSLERGLQIYEQLRGNISGLAIPSYVMEIPGGGGKIRVDGNRVRKTSDGRWMLQSPIDGRWSEWIDPIEQADSE